MPSAGTKNVCHSEQPSQSAHKPVDATVIAAALPTVMPVACGTNIYHSEQPSQLAHSVETTVAAPSLTGEGRGVSSFNVPRTVLDNQLTQAE